MMLALRSQPATDAKWLDKQAHWLIKARLVTRYPHAGIVIGETLYHATAKRGLHASEYTPERWELFDLGDEMDAEVMELFNNLKGTQYDMFSLLAFIGIPFRDSKRMYCFEWCYLAMTGEQPKTRVTAETLLELYIKTTLNKYP